MRLFGVSLVLLCLACGCTSTSTYRTRVVLTPGPKPGEYTVSGRVQERTSAWYCHRIRELSVPTMVFLPGKPASSSVSAEASSNGVFLDAYVARQGDEKTPYTTCVLTVKRGGKVVLLSEVRLPPLAPAAPAAESPALPK